MNEAIYKQMKHDETTEKMRRDRDITIEEFDEWLTKVKKDAVIVERSFWINTLENRIDELNSCHKDDDCHTLASGIELALEDALYFIDERETE